MVKILGLIHHPIGKKGRGTGVGLLYTDGSNKYVYFAYNQNPYIVPYNENYKPHVTDPKSIEIETKLNQKELEKAHQKYLIRKNDLAKYGTSLDDLVLEQKLPQSQRSGLIKEFVKYCIQELSLKSPLPKIKLTSDKTKTETYGHMDPMNNEIVTYIGERNLGDCLRTIGHELVHEKQKQENRIKENSGKTGSPEENEANALAGILLREFGKKYPQIFE